MYEEAGGPKDEELFDISKPFSSSCYVFLVVHPALLVGTRQKVNKPYVVFLAHQKMELNRDPEEVAPGLNAFTMTETIGGSVDEPFIYEPKPLSIEEANRHLKFGYYNSFETDNPKQLTGEAVIIYRLVDGVIADIVKVHSPSYEWRIIMRGNNPNIVHQFYCMLTMVYNDVSTPAHWAEFQSRFILLPLYDEGSVKSLYDQTKMILTIPSGKIDPKDYADRNSRIHLLWLNYLLSLPPHIQGDALNILSNFKVDRDAVISWVQDLEKSTNDIENADLPDRVKGVIGSARRLSRDTIANGKNYSAKGSYIKLPVLIKSTIRNLINKENGPSLYSLVTAMKEYRSQATTQEQVQETEQ